MMKNRMMKATVTAVALAAALTASAVAPASAATFTAPAGYTYQLTSYRTWYGTTRYFYRLVPATQTAPAPTVSKPAPAPTPTVTPAPATNTTAGMTAEEQQMLNLVNAERAKNGLAPLKADSTLTTMARDKSQDMITSNYFAHQSPTYGSPFDMMAKYGVTYRAAGENIAGNQSVTAAFNAWMNSPGHRANILGSQYNLTGIGIVHGGPYGIMFTQEFVGR
jgi:uncharacterized YkwD family protein